MLVTGAKLVVGVVDTPTAQRWWEMWSSDSAASWAAVSSTQGYNHRHRRRPQSACPVSHLLVSFFVCFCVRLILLWRKIVCCIKIRLHHFP